MFTLRIAFGMVVVPAAVLLAGCSASGRATVDESWFRSRGAELLEFSPDDKTLLTSDGRGRVFIWDVARLRRGRRE